MLGHDVKITAMARCKIAEKTAIIVFWGLSMAKTALNILLKALLAISF
jgi:hypothetical protein